LLFKKTLIYCNYGITSKVFDSVQDFLSSVLILHFKFLIAPKVRYSITN